eukprot:COSAG02_NODE_240_length_27672_cov_67.291445_7_plen_311_part_00
MLRSFPHTPAPRLPAFYFSRSDPLHAARDVRSIDRNQSAPHVQSTGTQYSQNLAECNSWCEKASADDGCGFQIPGVSGKDGSIQMCGTCDCGLHDCPGHPPPEPEQCKDPAHGGPEGGDCGWQHRCRGSLEGCKLGCKLQQSAGRSGWGFMLVLCLSSAGYIGIGIGIRVKRNGAPAALASHPHYRQWQELAGLVTDGVQMTQAKLTGKPIARQTRGGGGAGGVGYTAISTSSSSPPSSEKRKPKDNKKKSKKKTHSSDAAETTADSRVMDDGGTAAQASNSGPAATPAGSPAVKGTASAGGGRWVHVPG